MAKVKTVYVCQSCGAQSPRWAGQCPQCRTWNSLVEEIQEARSTKHEARIKSQFQSKVVKASEVMEKKASFDRLSTGSIEFDRVLGGGIVSGSVQLVAGEPGIGKSTLLTQLAMRVGRKSQQVSAESAKIGLQKNSDKSDASYSDTSGLSRTRSSADISRNTGFSVLYVCGEESPSQVGLRISRLDEARSPSAKLRTSTKSFDKAQGKHEARNDNILLLATTDVDLIVDQISKIKDQKLSLVIVDSIQTLTTGDLSGMAGSVGQVRESANRLIAYAKATGVPVMIVGHVTKDGTVAGPKVLEHMVDGVLTLEGEKTGLWRVLRAAKNRFGATDEVGVFSMEEGGLVDVANPSGAFLEESQAGKPGSAVAVVMEGTRPVLLEVQALAVSSVLPVPRRVAAGVPLARVQLLVAILTKYCRLPLSDRDVYVNVAGGLKVNEPAADLALAMAIASSVKGKALPKQSIVVGEVGLLGEIRRVAFLKRRVKEAKALGYTKAITPETVGHITQAVSRLGES